MTDKNSTPGNDDSRPVTPEAAQPPMEPGVPEPTGAQQPVVPDSSPAQDSSVPVQNASVPAQDSPVSQEPQVQQHDYQAAAQSHGAHGYYGQQPYDQNSAATAGAPQAAAYPAEGGYATDGTAATNEYATPGQYPTTGQYPAQGNVPPAFGGTSTMDAATEGEKKTRRTSVGVIAAVAIAAVVGGVSGAGMTALIASQSSFAPSQGVAGAQNVVVNNPDQVNQTTAVAAKASPSVMTISVSGGQSSSSSGQGSGGTGSGVVIGADGYVLTNTHVVTLDGTVSKPQISVQASDGKQYSASVVGTDPLSDLAVIKLNNASGLPTLDFADSSTLNVGDLAVAIGSPMGLSGTVTNGIVSALNRSIEVASSAAPNSNDAPSDNGGSSGGSSPFDFWNYNGQQGQSGQSSKQKATIALPVVQTDASINPGNSGGALLNASGQLIGINVAILGSGSSDGQAGSIGLGFAVTSNLAKRVANDLISKGSTSHGLLGASISAAANSSTAGATVQSVTAGGPAEKAGLKTGDVVTNINGIPVTNQSDLTAQVRALPAGATADLTVIRGGQATTIKVELGSA